MTRGSRLATLLQCRPSLRLFSQHEEELKLCTAKEQREHDRVTNELMFKLDMLHKGYYAEYQAWLNDRQSWLEREAEYLRRCLLPHTPFMCFHLREMVCLVRERIRRGKRGNRWQAGREARACGGACAGHGGGQADSPQRVRCRQARSQPASRPQIAVGDSRLRCIFFDSVVALCI